MILTSERHKWRGAERLRGGRHVAKGVEVCDYTEGMILTPGLDATISTMTRMGEPRATITLKVPLMEATTLAFEVTV